MKKRSKQLYMYGFISLLIFSLNAKSINAAEYKNYFGIEMNNQQYNNLLELGFSEDEIYYMSEETFESNKDILSTLVANDTKYYKSVYTDLDGNSYSAEVSAAEYENQSPIQTRGYVETTYKKVVTTMSQLDNQFRYKVTTAWKQMPSVRSYDIIGIGFSDAVYISSLVNFSYTYALPTGEYINDGTYYFKQKISTGGSAVYKFPTEARAMTAVLYYDIAKINSSSTITSLEMCGDYAHATTNVSASNYNSHGIDDNGILLGSNIGYYDAIPCAVSSWGGTW